MLLLAMLLTACGTKEENAVQETTDTAAVTETLPETTVLEALGDKKFDNANYTIMDANDYQATYQNVPLDEYNGDIVNDALYDRDMYMEDKYDITLSYILTTTAEGYAQIKNDITAGDYNVHLLNGGFPNGRSGMATEGYFMNLMDFDTLALDQPWWSPLMYENLSYKDRMYIITSDIAPTRFAALSSYFINVDLLEDYQIENNYYQKVYDGIWTLDELALLNTDTSQDLNGDGKMTAEDDFFGFIYMKNEVTSGAFLCGAGVQLSTVTDDAITVDLMNDRVSSIVDRVHTIIGEPVAYQDQANIMATFQEDRAIAIVHLTASGKNWFRDMESDFMILPPPKYDEAQESYISYMNIWTTADFSIPILPEDQLEMTDFITEALARYSYLYIRPAYYDVVLKQKTVRDKESSDMLDIIFNNAYVDFNAVYNFGGTQMAMVEVFFNDKPLASTITGLMTKAETTIAEFQENWVQ